MQMSVTRGLVQLKRLEQRINKKINSMGSYVTYAKKSSKNVNNGTYTKDEFEKLAKAEYQSLKDLIALRKEIKDAIVQSNATTMVNICGVEYTIAQAIERKNSIELFDSELVRKVSRSYSNVLDKVDFSNSKVEADAQRLFGTATDDKKSEINRIEMMEKYIDINSFEVVDPLNFKVLVESIEKDANDFLSEVDQVLSESNAVTMIEVSKNPMEIK